MVRSGRNALSCMHWCKEYLPKDTWQAHSVRDAYRKKIDGYTIFYFDCDEYYIAFKLRWL